MKTRVSGTTLPPEWLPTRSTGPCGGMFWRPRTRGRNQNSSDLRQQREPPLYVLDVPFRQVGRWNEALDTSGHMPRGHPQSPSCLGRAGPPHQREPLVRRRIRDGPAPPGTVAPSLTGSKFADDPPGPRPQYPSLSGQIGQRCWCRPSCGAESRPANPRGQPGAEGCL